MLLLFQQFKMEAYKLKCLNRDVELQLARHVLGSLNLLVYRVKYLLRLLLLLLFFFCNFFLYLHM
jgi:hypothetical protein